MNDFISNLVVAAVGIAIGSGVTSLYRRRTKGILLRALRAEIMTNIEYTIHNSKTAENAILKKPTKGSYTCTFIPDTPFHCFAFLPFKTEVCNRLLNSGEFEISQRSRDTFTHYLVVLDHVNTMVNSAKELAVIKETDWVKIHAVHAYCKFKTKDDGIWKNIIHLTYLIDINIELEHALTEERLSDLREVKTYYKNLYKTNYFVPGGFL